MTYQVIAYGAGTARRGRITGEAESASGSVRFGSYEARGSLRRGTATQRRAAGTHTPSAIAGGRASKRRRPRHGGPWPGRAEGGGKGGGGRGHVPTEISEFFVDTLESHGVMWCGVVDLVVVVVLWLMCCAESWAEQDVKASGVAVAVAAARTWHGTSS